MLICHSVKSVLGGLPELIGNKMEGTQGASLCLPFPEPGPAMEALLLPDV